ncbi:hypothetical protein AYI70_g6977 [Smittium culicis]|uniref:Uncharacterized protein n=1 Tax=Smittium culicis TaxID=133412 RepID=A0A1R1XML1_9FUNG|nr:hypothetical protein AYI70_g6977 [Smittium culicis]
MDSYQYLGIPYTKNGLDMIEYCNTSSEKAIKLTKFLHVIETDRISKIIPESRHPNTLADVSLFLSNNVLIRQAIRWRMSSYGFGTICPICKGAFKYTHVTECLNFPSLDEFYIFNSKANLESKLKSLMQLAPPK